VYTEGTGITIAARMFKYTGATGSIVETNLGESVTLTKADGVLSGSHTLATPYVIEAGYAVAVKIVATTQGGDSVTVGCVHVAAK
jgi:TPP-dependent pyruvate/acetoin dehydrogenase alpha subunit